MRLSDSALWLPCHSEPVRDTEFMVENLSSGVGYRFRVAALNKAGMGEPVQLPQTVYLGKRPLPYATGTERPHFQPSSFIDIQDRLTLYVQTFFEMFENKPKYFHYE